MDPLRQELRTLELRLNRTFNNRNALHNLGRLPRGRELYFASCDAYMAEYARAFVVDRYGMRLPAEDAALQDRQAAVRLLKRVLAARAL